MYRQREKERERDQTLRSGASGCELQLLLTIACYLPGSLMRPASTSRHALPPPARSHPPHQPPPKMNPKAIEKPVARNCIHASLFEFVEITFGKNKPPEAAAPATRACVCSDNYQ